MTSNERNRMTPLESAVWATTYVNHPGAVEHRISHADGVVGSLREGLRNQKIYDDAAERASGVPPVRHVRPIATREVIYGQIDAERGRQILQWGGDEHDDGHKRRAWVGIIREHTDRLIKSRGDSWRHRLVVIAATCVAAIEAHDRKTGAIAR